MIIHLQTHLTHPNWTNYDKQSNKNISSVSSRNYSLTRRWEEEVYGPEQIDEVLKKVDGKWAIVSKKTGRPLAYYKGEGKPSDEWFRDQEKRIQYFKNRG